MVTLILYKIYKDFRALDDGRDTESITAWSKEDLYENVIRNWFSMNEEELSSVPDNIIVSKIDTYPEVDIPNFNKDKCTICRNSCIVDGDIYTYSIDKYKWIKSNI